MSHDVRLSWSPTRAFVVRAFMAYGCALSLIPVTRIRCEELTEALDVRAYARSGLQDIEAFLQFHR